MSSEKGFRWIKSQSVVITIMSSNYAGEKLLEKSYKFNKKLFMLGMINYRTDDPALCLARVQLGKTHSHLFNLLRSYSASFETDYCLLFYWTLQSHKSLLLLFFYWLFKIPINFWGYYKTVDRPRPPSGLVIPVTHVVILRVEL